MGIWKYGYFSFQVVSYIFNNVFCPTIAKVFLNVSQQVERLRISSIIALDRYLASNSDQEII